MHVYYSKGRMISHTQPRFIRITIRGNVVEISVKGINPCDAEFTFLFKVQHHKNSLQLPKPCHVGIHLKALAEHYQMSTIVPGFQSTFFKLFSFCPNQPPAAQRLIVILKDNSTMNKTWAQIVS